MTSSKMTFLWEGGRHLIAVALRKTKQLLKKLATTDLIDWKHRNKLLLDQSQVVFFIRLERILEILDSVAGLKVEKSGGGAGGEVVCGETGVELLTRERQSLDILSVKKEAKLSASELAEV